MKAVIKSDKTHNPFDEIYRVSCLRENLTSSSKGEGLETGRRSTLNGHAGGNPGYSQGRSYGLPRQSFTRQLIFKACKNSLNANQITSSDENIIESLLLASIAAHLSSYTLFNIGIEQLEEKKQWAISFQRVAKVAVVLARDFILFLLNSSREHVDNLLHKIKLFANEMYDPNYKKRETSFMRINRLLSEGEV